MIRVGGGWRGLMMAGLLAALAACGDAADPADAPTQADTSAARELDALALDAGALPDQGQIDPAGRYARRYDGGSDRLCLLPDSQARGRYRFGAETRIGQEEYCRGAGSAKRAGDSLLLQFDGAGRDCLIVARYEGDKIVLPGGLDVACAALCSSRGSFAGVSFPRVDRDIAAARTMRDKDAALLCR